ncbi:MAG: hypothetical protein ACJ749_06805 [Flavisolibacter sp.]|jgi:hypothetical protein
METVNPNNQLTVIDKSIEVFKGGSAILLSHQNRSKKALAVAQDILNAWDNAYLIEDPEQRAEALAIIDQRSNKFLANCGAAVDDMQESRKAITQLMDMIKKMFTEEENKLDVKKDTLPAKVQVKRNAYAKELFEEQKRKRKLAEQKVAKAKEELEIRSWIKNAIANCLLTFLSKKKISITNSFNAITLADYDQKAGSLKLMPTSFPLDKLREIIAESDIGTCGTVSSRLHSIADLRAIQASEHAQYNFPSFYNEYGRQIAELKQSLIDQLPSKKEELLQQKRIADEAEERRQQELKLQAEAEKKRQEELAAAKTDEERKRREREAEEARRAEAERLAALERESAEKQRLAQEEQRRREEEERLRLEREAFEAKKAEEEKAELEKVAGTAQLLFNQVEEASLTTPSPETRNSFEITVTHPAGWVELFQFWFQREGCKMKIDDMGKKSLNQMKAYAEGVAKKDDVKIESKFLRYETAIKSVNRKTVVQ